MKTRNGMSYEEAGAKGGINGAGTPKSMRSNLPVVHPGTEKTQFKPGNGRGGRKKGSKNRIPMTLQVAIEKSFQKLGGVSYLVRMGESHPQAYLALLGKIIPRNITVSAAAGEPRDMLEVARRIAFILALADKKTLIEHQEIEHGSDRDFSGQPDLSGDRQLVHLNGGGRPFDDGA